MLWHALYSRVKSARRALGYNKTSCLIRVFCDQMEHQRRKFDWLLHHGIRTRYQQNLNQLRKQGLRTNDRYQKRLKSNDRHVHTSGKLSWAFTICWRIVTVASLMPVDRARTITSNNWVNLSFGNPSCRINLVTTSMWEPFSVCWVENRGCKSPRNTHYST